ncbi:DNA helicase; transcript release factor [NY_014 poxvirus]|uniref:DNA helicase; transcript release factor n=1 Tax=NY_014 poxvirus TaxID=2025360 RepID=UPI000B99FC40|nr:DNA helicase; transcript release factor [NY_014 poxvirus]AST09531.1 DNA helicase; transcript release factor [NY_014 poxvirus]
MSLLKMDYNLYSELKSLTNNNPVNLFNERGEFSEVVPGSSFKYIVPPGLFSSITIKTNLIFESSSHNKITTGYDSSNAPTLYPLQRKVVSTVFSTIRKMISEKRPIYITLHLACGFGKTITTCHLISSHCRKTVICVPNKLLIHQWKVQVEAFGLDHVISVDGVTRLLKEKLSSNNPDVLIIVSRHLINDEFCKHIHKYYDVFILDESHTYNLMNNTAVTKFLAYYPPSICYFLTATPRQSNRIYNNNVINVIKLSNLKKTLKVIDNFFEPYSNDSIRQMVKKLDKVSNKYHVYTEKLLSIDTPRNNLIIDTVIKEFRSESINRVLIVTKLRDHMILFYKKLSEIFGTDIVFLGDAQNKSTPETVKSIKQLNRFIFISTLFYSGTGLDIPNLDSLFICSAVINNMQIEQLFGRVCRETEVLDRTAYVFPNTSIREIKYTVGNFIQRVISLATDKLGFTQEGNTCKGRVEHALHKVFSEQNH